MNTPAHLVVNLALLTGGRRRDSVGPVVAGALTPDLPMLVFYVWERLLSGASEAQIWSTLYFDPGWQRFFDVFNSIPLALVGLALAWRFGRPRARLFFASLLLHVALDLPLHREDAHGHFFPLSDWRFMSPVSYWDPAHHGVLASVGEALLVAASSVVLWRRTPDRRARGALLLLNALYVVGVSLLLLGFAPELEKPLTSASRLRP